MTILSMQESGRIQVLYNKWWKNTGVCVSDDKKKESKASSLAYLLTYSWCCCPRVLVLQKWFCSRQCSFLARGSSGKASSLGVANVGGIFVVLFVGLALAVIVAGVEFVWNNRQQAPAVNRLNKQVPDPRPRSCLSIYFTL